RDERRGARGREEVALLFLLEGDDLRGHVVGRSAREGEDGLDALPGERAREVLEVRRHAAPARTVAEDEDAKRLRRHLRGASTFARTPSSPGHTAITGPFPSSAPATHGSP